MGFEEFEKLEELKWSLAYAIASGLYKKADEILLVDYTGGNKSYSARAILEYALALSEKLDALTSAKRIAIALPPSFASVAINFACIFAKKIPVNLNFTMGPSAAKSCIENSGADTIVTMEPMRKKIADANPAFPWTDKVFDLAEFFAQKDSRISTKDLSFEDILKKYKIEKYADNKKEATLIFTSGSEGAPKAAILTERNLIANALQTKLNGVFKDDDVLLGNLPIFHSFGALFELWYMAIMGFKTIMLASPIDIKTNLHAMAEYKPSVMIGTPTFFRAYLRYANEDGVKNIRRIIAGAEKTPAGFDKAWDSVFGEGSYKEGYGLTEASPVVGVNTDEGDFGWYSTGTKAGSIGKLFPGMQARILHPETLEPLPLGEQGLLSLRGANVFPGYLNNPEATKKMLDGDWLISGDLSRLDAEGYVFVDGRLSRFSKIGGEMVPHATVENALANGLKLPPSDLQQLAISARLDEGKGEALVLVTTVDLELHTVKETLRSAGISNLWMPKYIVKAEKIPMLASGKLDLKALADLAKG